MGAKRRSEGMPQQWAQGSARYNEEQEQLGLTTVHGLIVNPNASSSVFAVTEIIEALRGVATD